MKYAAAAGLQDIANDNPWMADLFNIATLNGHIPFQALVVLLVLALVAIAVALIRRK